RQNSRTPRVLDIDVAALEIHSNARSSVLFNHLTCPAEDIECMSVKNPMWGCGPVEDLAKKRQFLALFFPARDFCYFSSRKSREHFLHTHQPPPNVPRQASIPQPSPSFELAADLP